jgi:hypothetical protein
MAKINLDKFIVSSKSVLGLFNSVGTVEMGKEGPVPSVKSRALLSTL